MSKYWNDLLNLSPLALIGQIFFLILIILGAIILFRRNKIEVKNTDLVYASIFVVIPLILSIYLSFYIPLAGVNAFKIGFAQPVMAAGGAILNSPLGYLIGIVVDILGIILMPSGTPYLGFTFNAAMVFVIGWLVFKYTQNDSENRIRNIIYSIYALMFSLFSILILMVKSIKLESLVIQLDEILFLIPNRYLLILLIFVFIFVLVIITHYTVLFLHKQNKADVYRFILISILIELLINIILTSMHIHALYSIPIIALVVPRMIKAFIFLPINTIISYFVYKTVKRVKR